MTVRSVSITAVALIGVIAVVLVGAQGRHPVSGRRIAGVMGHEGAAWLERPERESEEAPSKAIAALKIHPGQTVADIGAGSGYYAVRLADAVGPRGLVYATDLQPQMLALIKQKIDAAAIRNIEMILGSETESRLPAAAVDLAIMVDVYHELAQPQAFLASLKKSLRPNARLVLIEFRKEDPRVPIREEHKMSVAEARTELEAEDFRFDQVIDVLPWQHILVFRPAAIAAK
ncbi:MAG: methyltransferase domain-containing protein [Acidobacteria bacterium]|nr:methyltransferase domain-containing protein [Acidobacteriota bacterium]